MNFETELKTRLALIMGDEAKHPFRWATKIGINGATFNRVWKQGGELKSDYLRLIREKTGVSVDWLLTGQGPMYSVESFAERVAPYNIQPVGAGGVTADSGGDFVLIPMMHGKISAGGGLIPDDRPEMVLAFRKEWAARKGDPARMSAIRVEGDSMTPTLQHGDVVLVNHNVQSVTVNGGIYAIAVAGQIAVKRITLVFPDHRLRIISDNKEYPESTAEPGQITINGKVIWYGRDLEK